MSKVTPMTARVFLMLALMLVSMLVWSTVAAAQTPADVQYGSPTDTSTGDPSATGNSSTIGDPSATGNSSAAGGSSASGDVQSSESLPSTGGPPLLVLLVASGSLALGAFGLLALRRSSER